MKNCRLSRGAHLSRLIAPGLAVILAGAMLARAQERIAASPDDASTEKFASDVQERAGAEGASRPGPAAVEGIPTRLSDMFQAAGPLRWPLLGCSFLMMAVIAERLVVLRKSRVIPRDFVLRFLENIAVGQLDRQTALQLCEENASPIAEVFAHGIRKWGKPSVEVEQAIIDGGERQVGQLRRRLRVLNAISTVAPLLGLLGTTIGMIICFNQIATSSAMGKSEALAGGIGIALINTAGGLCVAIPALIMYMYFAGRVDELVLEMDSMAQKLVNLISAEGLAMQAASASSRPPARSKPAPPAMETKEPARATVRNA